jgi:integrase/recombinase XerD
MAEVRVEVGDDIYSRISAGRKDCKCALWLDGLLDGKEIRMSLKTRHRGTAINKCRAMISDGDDEEKHERSTIQHATTGYLADARSRKLADCTISKYELLFRQLGAFAQNKGFRFIDEISVPALDEFRSQWADGPRSSQKKLERLRTFFRFCEDRDLIQKNPAIRLKSPKIKQRPTMPFSQEEMIRILAAIPEYEKTARMASAQRLRAFILVLRYSGMRIGDVVQLRVDQITGNRLFLYTQKTGTAVSCVLPEFVIRELERTPKSSAGYFFWTGKSKIHNSKWKWQRRLKRIFELALVENGHAHRFRDTFAVELLLNRMPLGEVSILLGHSSIKTTEKHYNPWVRARQEQLEADLERAWSQDPIAISEMEREFGAVSRGTNRVQAKNARPN